jgi:tetratricopeptide (TPR) repeat protein
VTDELAEHLAAVDMAELGRRIRRARTTRALTQAALAGTDVSVGYISRIEAGQRRPDVSVLERLAERLELPPLVLVTGGADPTVARLQLALDHAELALRAGSVVEARNAVLAVWADVLDCGVPELELRARLTRALALEALGGLDEAIIELEDLLAVAAHDPVWSLRPAIALSRCYRESGDLVRAIDVGERHLEVLQRLELEGADEAVQLVVTVAAAHFERGDTAHAARMCRRAVEQAERLGSPLARASAYWNASVVESRRGHVEAAVPLAAKALRLLEAAEDDRNLPRLQSQLGEMQLLLDPPQLEEARVNLEAARVHYELSGASPVDVAHNSLSIAHAELLAGNLDVAEAGATSVLERIRGTAPLVTADALMLLGRIAARRGDAAQAARRYRDVVLELSGIGSDRRAAEAWFELGTLLDEMGLERQAHDAYRSAAASAGLGSLGGLGRTRVLRG